MANTTANVSTGKPATSGAIWYGEANASGLPTDATTTIGSGFTCVGYVSEDGLTNSNTPSTDKIKAWGGDTVVIVQTEKEDTFTFTLVEALNADVLKVVYGDDNVSGSISEGLTIKANSKELDNRSFVIDMILRDGALKRICIPNGAISEIGEIAYTDSDAIGYELTIDALPDSNGNTHYEYIKKA